jgi:hypothetical protein
MARIGVQDVAHRQDADQLTAPHDRQVADSQLQHQVGRICQLVVGLEDLRGRGHEVRHRGDHRVGAFGKGGGEVPLGDDPDQVLALQDRKGADLMPVHAVGRHVQALVRLGGEQLVVLQVGDLHWCLLCRCLAP